MRCDWNAFVNILPLWMRETVDKQGRETLLELRLRLGLQPELVTMKGSIWLNRTIKKDDLIYCVNAASRYSPWAAETMSRGYITALGGHRLGICGTATMEKSNMKGISNPTSICLRVARDFPGIAKGFSSVAGSILIIGNPGSGKTTLLRDLIRQKGNAGSGCICVVDEKGELFPSSGDQFNFNIGKRTDVITGFSKKQGIELVLRNMCPTVIAVDEITAEEDCQALVHAGWCGVNLFATAHARNLDELMLRPVYHPLIKKKLFDTVVILQQDKSWRLERII